MSRGYATVVSDGPLHEWDTVTCRHCQQIVFVKPGTAAAVYLVTRGDGTIAEEGGAFCRRCMGPVCLNCHAHGRCVPWERRLEQSEARDRLRRQIDGLLS